MKGALLFSGGKDSMYSYLRAREVFNIDVQYLIFIKPTFASPHELNAHIVYLIAKLLNKKLVVTSAAELSETLARLDINFLIAADIYVWDHLYWLKRVCEDCGVDLIEPILCMNTYEVVERAVRAGIKFMIIAVDRRILSRDAISKLLGLIVSKDNIDNFFKLADELGIDPAGESGEYHSIVIDSSLMSYSIIPDESRVCRSGRYIMLGIKRVKLLKKD